ncbi:glycosyl transferase family 2 [Eubacterium sp. An11]|uniref:glycosyltransferase n=1 Tax=Eubacterium sp. An11 TaxID=1965542 RepID=UPI000B399685|nr:glycosyltransferase [Eubacterium sp. An11]OUQ68464.1 glycosyl transferase family 2 [Eubacterium sp. An11]
MKIKEKNFVSAVIYVHNAENRIEKFLRTIIEVMEDNFEHSEIICVNDCSEDCSSDVIKKVSALASTTSVSIINMSYFHGVENAMNAGVDLSIGDFVFEFDNTYLDFAPSVIMDIYYRSLQGYDIVSASSNRRERVSSKLFYKVFEKYTDLSYEMTTESFRVLSRRVINRISSMNKTIPYRKAVYANCGLMTDNIKYNKINSIQETLDKREKKFRSGLAVDSLILFTNMGYSFAKTMTVLMMFMSMIMIIYSVVIYATSNPVAGWTTTVLFLSIAFFGLFGILTIIIKYLQLCIDLVFKKKHYSFENIEKLTK